MLREPGGVELSERIRALVKDPRWRSHPRAEALLYAAARAQLVAEQLEPLLAAGQLGAARPLRRLLARLPGRRPRARGRGDPRAQPVRHRRAGARPHAAAADRPARRARTGRRARARPPTGSSARSSRSSTAIAAAYDALAAAEPERFAVIDAAQEPPGGAGRLRRGARAAASVAVAVRVGLVPDPRVGDHRVQAAPRGPAELVARAFAFAATSSGGSPARRPSSRTAISRPVTRRAASITSRTV